MNYTQNSNYPNVEYTSSGSYPKKRKRKRGKKKRRINYSRIMYLIMILISIIMSIYCYNDAKKVRVVIDAGHGGNDVGSAEGNRYEKDDTLELATMVYNNLKWKKNVKVIMTRVDDTYVSLEDRVKIANKKKASLFVSIHRNEAGSGNGVEIWIPSEHTKKEKEVAEDIMSGLNETNISRSRGVKAGMASDIEDDYYVNKNVRADSMIIELGFMSSMLDNNLFDQNKKTYAKVIADNIAKHIDYYDEIKNENKNKDIEK